MLLEELNSSGGCIILDACCILNLYASGQMDAMLKCLSRKVAVAAYVRDVEAQRILSLAQSNTAPQYEPIDLQPLIDSGLLIIVSPENEAENTTYTDFATALDDGEAITGAIAYHRNWIVGTDDRKATSYFAQHASHLKVISTPELMRHWVDTDNPAFDDICAALRMVRLRARYEPHRDHKLRDWWRQYCHLSC